MFFVVPVIAGAQLSVSCISLLLHVIRATRSWVRFPHGALLALGGRSSPDLLCSGGLSPGPFCVEFACSPRVHKGFPPLRTPTEKHANRTILSVPDRDGRFTWSPGAEKLPTAPGRSWRKDVPGWEKSRARIHGDC